MQYKLKGWCNNWKNCCPSVGRCVAQSGTDSYFSQRWKQQKCCMERQWRGIWNWAIRVATKLRDKLKVKLPNVTQATVTKADTTRFRKESAELKKLTILWRCHDLHSLFASEENHRIRFFFETRRLIREFEIPIFSSKSSCHMWQKLKSRPLVNLLSENQSTKESSIKCTQYHYFYVYLYEHLKNSSTVKCCYPCLCSLTFSWFFSEQQNKQSFINYYANFSVINRDSSLHYTTLHYA